MSGASKPKKRKVPASQASRSVPGSSISPLTGKSVAPDPVSLDDDEPVSLWRDRLTFTVRIVPGILERARWRNNLAYRLSDDFTFGIEYNPLADDVHPTANWRLLDETATRPAIMAGTSSDRIGTPHGTATYLTLSKSLKRETGLPIAPYVGINYSSYDDRFSFIGGGNIQLTDKLGLMAIYDGMAVHGALSYTTGRHTFSLLAVDLDDEYHAGVGWSVRF